MVLFDIVVFILVLGLMVFFHELGHFLAAKACGVYVDRFSLGMPPRVVGIRLGETDSASARFRWADTSRWPGRKTRR